ncbi:MAG: tetratricopeptide repeat protein, partial [Elusimicrobiales bacterium]|nr:tetratricopeptide repeat protein [Elusimicrobiales bacterium]
ISECSKLASQDKFIGYLCLCRVNRINLKTDLAILSCSKAKVKNPFSPYPHIEFAEIYTSKNKNDAALTEIEFAINIDSGNFHANLKAAELMERKNLNKSLQYYSKSLEILKKSNEPYIIGKKIYIENKISEIKSLIEKKLLEENEKRYLKCISDYKKEKNTDKSLEIIENCLSMKSKHNESVYMDYLTLLYKAEKFEEIIKLKNLEKELSKTNKSKFEEILANSYYKLSKYHEAIKIYKKLITEETYDISLLYNYANSLERSGDKINALEIYKKINTIKPSQKISEKIEDLKIEIMSDEEILEDLKIRGFVDKEKTVLLPPEKKLFLSIKLIEKNGAIKYLIERYPGYANIIWKNPSNNEDLRITLPGYNLYLKTISQKLIKAIEKEAHDPRDIFKVKDSNGFDIFDKSGNLTYEGIKCFYEYQKTNKKNWYFPHEKPQIKPQESYLNIEKETEFNNKKKEIEKLGYEEISETEYLWLLSVTNCPEDILLRAPCNIKKLDSGNGLRYFICMKEGLCNKTQMILASYITSYRSGNLQLPNTNTASNFFGKPSSSKKRFCENGKIWQGE